MGRLSQGYANPACVSPIIGRKFIENTYGGNGPYFSGYRHLWADRELWRVAEIMGVLHTPQDITHYHAHWSRGHGDNLPFEKRAAINLSAEADARLFIERQKAGFPGAFPEPAMAKGMQL